MPIKVIDADFYFIAPLYINNWEAFEKEFQNTSKWTNRLDESKGSLKDFLSCFLGEKESDEKESDEKKSGEKKFLEFPMQAGKAYNGLVQRSDNEALKSINGEFKFKNSKGKPLDAGDDIFFTMASNAIVLHVSPNHKCAIAYIRLKCKSAITLDQAVSLNYQLHTSDRKQTPRLYMKDAEGEWVCTPGRVSLIEIIKGMLPDDAYDFAYPDRFISSSVVRLDTSDNPDQKEITDSIVRLGQAEGHKYKITDEACSKVYNPFDNIRTYASTEGFVTVVLSPDPKHEKNFIETFNNDAFIKSYLPLYLAAILADYCLTSALRYLDIIADDIEEQDRLREACMVYKLLPAHFTHLNRVMENIRADRQFDLKYGFVIQSVEARRIRNESQRLKLEEEARKAEEEARATEEKARKLEEQRMAQLEKSQARRDRFMNLLLGFIGIGQVVFAVLQLAGAKDIFGKGGAADSVVQYSSFILSIIFIGLIIWLIIYLIIKNIKVGKS